MELFRFYGSVLFNCGHIDDLVCQWPVVLESGTSVGQNYESFACFKIVEIDSEDAWSASIDSNYHFFTTHLVQCVSTTDSQLFHIRCAWCIPVW